MTTPLAPSTATAHVVAPDPLAGLAPAVQWLVTAAVPSPEALALVTASGTLDGLVQAWLQAGHAPEVVRLMTALLPPREGAWWGWVSVRHAAQGGAPPATAAMHAVMAAVERWIGQPDDEHRRAVWDAANAAGLDSAIGMVGAAVFLSIGSVAPAGVSAVPPPPGAAPALLAGAILLAAAAVQPPERGAALQGAFITQGLDIIRRLGGWDAALSSAHERHLRAQAAQGAVTAASASSPR